MQDEVIDAGQSRQVSEDHSLSLIFNPDVPSGISHLLCRCRPSNVAGFVVTGIVDSVERMEIRRASTNVCKEIWEGRFPSVAHGDAAASVVSILKGADICASLFDALPYSVFTQPRSFWRETVSEIRWIGYFWAPRASGRPTFNQIPRSDDNLSATRTVAQVRLFVAWLSNQFRPNNGPFTKHLSKFQRRQFSRPSRHKYTLMVARLEAV